MGQASKEDRARSRAIYEASLRPGVLLKDIGAQFDICQSRVSKIVKREEARDRRADPLKWLAIDEARRRIRWGEYE